MKQTLLDRNSWIRGLVVKFFTETAFAHCARITLGTAEENVWLTESLDELLPDLARACA